ncbi:MAG: hypothetical protein FI718_08340 [SAR202 cluster bacterium]|nr:hypothetical protein [SAR202 cluster bacterium]
MARSNWYTQHPLACTCNQCHEKRLITQEADGKIGRNQPCPCGSEKKYKKCHGK